MASSDRLADAWGNPRLRGRIRRQLLTWFGAHRRELPWRANRDPYAIWVSEIMLQQTQVATVIPYFERFLQAFPTIADLAQADEQQVLRLWEGLGYYRRARHLHQAARLLAQHHDCQLPNDPDILADLPGLGRYTVGAILSQAFDTRLPILEANSRRVLCRLFALHGDPRSAPVEALLWQAAAALLPRRRVGDFNQALMELGALICTVTGPLCDDCPLRRGCRARQLGLQEVLPERQSGSAPEQVQEVAVVIERNGLVLLVQRPATARRWANMWEFPRDALGTDETHETHEAAAVRIARALVGVEVDVGGELLTMRYGVTRFQITLVALAAQHRRGEFHSDFYQQGFWVERERLHEYPVSSAQRKLARAVSAG